MWAVLKTCYDPEIPVNIVDLGLIYSMEMKKGEAGGRREGIVTLRPEAESGKWEVKAVVMRR